MKADTAPRRRFPRVSIRFLLPNLITLLGLCSGITAIRMAVEERYEFAVGGIIFAMVLDALDGRLARYLQGTSRFGAELDSLADFVNFGVAPALILYFYALNSFKAFGWVVCLLFAIGCALRLARFNVAIDGPKKPDWMGAYFTGLPAPAGAMLAMAPLYLGFLHILPEAHGMARWVLVYVLFVGALLVSRVPTFSGKTMTRVPRQFALPLLAVMAVGFILLISYPWETLAVLSAVYICFIPVSVLSYRRRLLAHGG